MHFFSKLHFKKYQTSAITCTLLSYQTTWICMLHDINSIHTIWVAPTHGVNINALHGQKELQNSLVLSNWNPSDPTLAQVPYFAHLSSKNMKHHGVYVNISIISSLSESGNKKKRHLSHHIDPPAAPSAWPWSAAYSHSRMQAYLPRIYTHGAVNVERFFFENTRYRLLYVFGLHLLILELPSNMSHFTLQEHWYLDCSPPSPPFASSLCPACIPVRTGASPKGAVKSALLQ